MVFERYCVISVQPFDFGFIKEDYKIIGNFIEGDNFAADSIKYGGRSLIEVMSKANLRPGKNIFMKLQFYLDFKSKFIIFYYEDGVGSQRNILLVFGSNFKDFDMVIEFYSNCVLFNCAQIQFLQFIRTSKYASYVALKNK